MATDKIRCWDVFSNCNVMVLSTVDKIFFISSYLNKQGARFSGRAISYDQFLGYAKSVNLILPDKRLYIKLLAEHYINRTRTALPQSRHLRANFIVVNALLPIHQHRI
jgi:hypothetical protein